MTDRKVVLVRVNGMHCGSCSSTIQTGLEALDGVFEAVVNHRQGTALVTFKSEPLNSSATSSMVAKIKEEIEDLGFDAGACEPVAAAPTRVIPKKSKTSSKFEHKVHGAGGDIEMGLMASLPKEGVNKKMVESTVSIKGMTCSSCVRLIETKLEGNLGVHSSSVNLMMESAKLRFDPTVTSATKLVKIISSLGFDATIKDTASGEWRSVCVRLIENLSEVHNILRSLKDTYQGVEATQGVTEVGVLDIKYHTKQLQLRQIMSVVRQYSPNATVEPSQNASNPVQEQRRELARYRWLLVTCLIFAIPTFFLAMILPLLPWHKAHHFFSQTVASSLTVHSLLLWILATPVQFGPGMIFYKSAYKALRAGSSNMSVLVALGTSAAYLYSLFGIFLALSGYNTSSPHFFETSTTLITFVILGKYLERYAKGKASESITRLIGLKVEKATLLIFDKENHDSKERTDNVRGRPAKQMMVSTLELERGDIILVKRGEQIPADGEVVDGGSTVNESMITGESLPVAKKVGSTVIGSTINQEGTMRIRVVSTEEHSTLAKILRLMEEAQTRKAPIQAYADRLSGMFVPIVLAIAFATFLIWFLLTPTVFDVLPEDYISDGETDVSFALLFAIAAIVIACPCALGLATPAAVMVATGLGAKQGILIKGGDALETSHRITTLVCDKTGTLTVGKLKVTDILVLKRGLSLREFLTTLGSIENQSEHPLAAAMVRFVRKATKIPKADLPECKSFRAESGKGVEGFIGGRKIVAGNRSWIESNGVKVGFSESHVTQLESDGKVVVLIADAKEIMGIVALADTPKPYAREVVSTLKKSGVKVIMCTGDSRRTAAYVAKQLSIVHVEAEMVPRGKLALVRKLQSQGEVVAMFGDGINDSAALTQANLGISVGTGSDIAMEAAQVVLMKSDIRLLLQAFALGTIAFRRIQLNLGWAFVYNLLGIPIACGLLYPFTGARLPPEIAALAMAMSSVSVIASSLALRCFYKPIEASEEPVEDTEMLKLLDAGTQRIPPKMRINNSCCKQMSTLQMSNCSCGELGFCTCRVEDSVLPLIGDKKDDIIGDKKDDQSQSDESFDSPVSLKDVLVREIDKCQNNRLCGCDKCGCSAPLLPNQ
mmetsp:Transcript_13106/g.32112  ORF Transcript_13106/g.32112 Transcript_13106/m.32112 type:complete len:1117 (-) Transcript_13106:387-3737(-)|eukprot:CAMPEP_0114538042 /NCGR_PEP_ID=MMETSP0109-20121206/29920_1 /TAXON_ID=29199 /ORGANISM="Chlorarachnion reptans, Strain CCCM449" /LENGTH=1116 /DNA_ID=CAMNT_0001722011 /DNA_START=88 /DNA_END=3438 /DNA_ORIENTATION=-